MQRDYVRILEEQKKELERLMADPRLVDRVQTERVDVNSPVAQIVIGVRRCGKSVVCRMALAKSGVKFGYIDFDDDALQGVLATDLNDVLKAAYIVYGPFEHLFLDEVQNVEGWQLFANRLLRGGMHLVITGSNSRLLSSEFATHMTGRDILIELSPFTFEEYRRCLGRGDVKTTSDEAEARRDYEVFAARGGLPETFVQPDTRAYFKTLFDSIIFRDVVQRRKVRFSAKFASLANTVMSNFACELSANRLARQLGISSPNTVLNYVGYLEEAYLIETVKLYGRKAWERTRLGKGYAIDMGLANHFKGFGPDENRRGRALENIVFLQLRNKRFELDYEIFFYKDRRREIDFVCVRGGHVVKLVQVSYEMSSEKTRERELSALFDMGRAFKCSDLLVVTDHDSEMVERDGLKVRVVDVVTWLLESAAEKMPDDYFAEGREAAEEARKAIAKRKAAKKKGTTR